MTRGPKPAADASVGTPEPVDALPRMALRLDELAKVLGVSRRTLERERAAGRFPRPDAHLGKMPLWRPETLQRWLAGGGS